MLQTDPTFKICRTRYPEYDFVMDQNVTVGASLLSNRYSEESLRGVIIDIELLSQTDFLVCTLSSNVSRTLKLKCKWHVFAESPRGWNNLEFEKKNDVIANRLYVV